MTEEEAAAQQAALLAAYGATPQDRERIGFPNFTYPPEDTPSGEAPAQSLQRGVGYPGDWLSGLISRFGPTQVPAPQIPPALAAAPAREMPMPPPPPRLAMPTQESHETLPTIFNPQSLAGPPVIDERVHPPTPTERQGLVGDAVGAMRNDPIALGGYNSSRIDWDRSPGGRNLGSYMLPQNRQNIAEGVEDTIRFDQGIPYYWPLDLRREVQTQPPPSMRLGAIGNATFDRTGAHEFRHRGWHQMAALARQYGIQFSPLSSPYYGYPYTNERMNVYQDRQLGYDSYAGDPNMQFDEGSRVIMQPMLDDARRVADQTNAARVARMHRTGETWAQTEVPERR